MSGSHVSFSPYSQPHMSSPPTLTTYTSPRRSLYFLGHGCGHSDPHPPSPPGPLSWLCCSPPPRLSITCQTPWACSLAAVWSPAKGRRYGPPHPSLSTASRSCSRTPRHPRLTPALPPRTTGTCTRSPPPPHLRACRRPTSPPASHPFSTAAARPKRGRAHGHTSGKARG
jgi:hypothetical protein